MKKHLHRYVRVVTENEKILFRCKKPGCGHYLLKIIIDGAEAECPGCEGKFVITGMEKYKKLPMCSDCRGKRKKKTSIEEIVPSSSVADLLKVLGAK